PAEGRDDDAVSTRTRGVHQVARAGPGVGAVLLLLSMEVVMGHGEVAGVDHVIGGDEELVALALAGPWRVEHGDPLGGRGLAALGGHAGLECEDAAVLGCFIAPIEVSLSRERLHN